MTDERFDAWLFVRTVLDRGCAIEQDSESKGRGYEQHSARLDAVAREFAGVLRPHLAEHQPDPRQRGPKPPASRTGSRGARVMSRGGWGHDS